MGYSRKKIQAVVIEDIFFEKNLETLISLLLYLGKFRIKQSVTAENSTKLCCKNMLHPWNSKTKKQYPCSTQIVFDLGIFSGFLINT